MVVPYIIARGLRYLRNTSISFSSAQRMVKYWSHTFHQFHIPEATLSAQHIIFHVIKEKNVNNFACLANRVLSRDEISDINHMCRQRLNRKPVQAIIGEWDFRTLSLTLMPTVFIPRPETEELVGLALDDLHGLPGAQTVLDVGCGNGVIALSLAKEFPQINVMAVDINPLACKSTQKNAELLGLTDRVVIKQAEITKDGLQGLDNSVKFDMIVSNPPYISDEDLCKLEPEVARYEDVSSLSGGSDGLNVIRMILNSAAHMLKENGSLWLEVDTKHPSLIENYVKQNNIHIRYIKTHLDFTKRPRFSHLKKC